MVQHVAGRAAELHAESAGLAADPGLPPRLVRVLDAVRPAVVLGSTQPATDVDDDAALAAGVEVARRRSGGGAVLVGPGRCVWVDLLIARGDPRWDDDVRVAPQWVGEAWAAALAAIDLPGGEVRRSMTPNAWSRRICFAGAGPGEVFVGRRKVVGIAQRRTGAHALFQCAVLIDPDPDPLLNVLSLSAEQRRSAGDLLRGQTLGVGAGRAHALVDAMVGPDGVLGP